MDTNKIQLRHHRKATKELFKGYRSKRIPVTKNSFPFVFVDLTYRCNMKCNVCYNPIRPMPDMSYEYFESALKKLPHPVEIRMLGGEPTLHKRFFDFCKVAFDHGHSVYVSSNGKRIAKSPQFVKELKKLLLKRKDPKSKLKIHMDMSGGLQRAFYKKIHAEDVLETKLKALKALSSVDIGRVTVSAILIKNFNESVIGDLFKIAEKFPRTIREVAFRSQGDIGRFIPSESPYKTNEWLFLMQKLGYLKKKHFSEVIHAGFMDQKCEGKNCCYHFRYSRNLTVSFLEFLNEGCWQRGQLLENEYEIEYMFESLVANDSNHLKEEGLLNEKDINQSILEEEKEKSSFKK
ncbi:MAG: radical SAM protein [Bdellovibrionales bacterium]|nr:radical SAM protein [Bdellovibrionales bacterium]